jgi:hypothetical protein
MIKETKQLADNELIALFMGWKKSDGEDGVYHRGQWYNDKFEHLAQGAELEYNTSWDWLMPVVEKIGDLYPEYPGRISDFMQLSIGSHIQQVYKDVIAFIKWYNENHH